MNDNAKKWVEALRSDEFEQAREALRDADGRYCCLGVACELYRRDVGGAWLGIGDFKVSDDEIMEDAELPNSVRDWLGLRDRCGSYSGTGLIAKNDGGSTFDEIADIIEDAPRVCSHDAERT